MFIREELEVAVGSTTSNTTLGHSSADCYSNPRESDQPKNLPFGYSNRPAVAITPIARGSQPTSTITDASFTFIDSLFFIIEQNPRSPGFIYLLIKMFVLPFRFIFYLQKSRMRDDLRMSPNIAKFLLPYELGNQLFEYKDGGGSFLILPTQLDPKAAPRS
ncbi:hypothetical protein ACTXT7_009172 [Hymenolepis weldensis]